MIELPPLPYPESALEPVISDRTMSFHYGKHHAAYVRNTNAIAEELGLAGRSLREIVISSTTSTPALVSVTAQRRKALYNNAAQAWNHGFFWQSMTPVAERPSGQLARLIDRQFGGFDKLKVRFAKAGAGHFGSGWLWLILRDGALKIVATHDARNFVARPDITSLLVCDLWEHAYYLDHQNDRAGFLEAWIDQLANWRFADSQLASAVAESAAQPVPLGRTQPAQQAHG